MKRRKVLVARGANPSLLAIRPSKEGALSRGPKGSPCMLRKECTKDQKDGPYCSQEMHSAGQESIAS